MTFLGSFGRICDTHPGPAAIAATTATLVGAYGLCTAVPPLIPVVLGGGTIQGMSVAELALLTHQGVSWTPYVTLFFSSATVMGGSVVTGAALRRLWTGPSQSQAGSIPVTPRTPQNYPFPTSAGQVGVGGNSFGQEEDEVPSNVGGEESVIPMLEAQARELENAGKTGGSEYNRIIEALAIMSPRTVQRRTRGSSQDNGGN